MKKEESLLRLLYKTSSLLTYPHATMTALMRHKLKTRLLEHTLQHGTRLINPTTNPNTASIIRCLQQNHTNSITYTSSIPPGNTFNTKHPLPLQDQFFYTYKLLSSEENITRELYETHRVNWAWWRDMTRKPTNLKQEVKREVYRIQYTTDEEMTVEIAEVEEAVLGDEKVVLMRTVKSLNACYLTFLEDSYHNIGGHEILKLHNKLVPFQVNVRIEGGGDEVKGGGDEVKGGGDEVKELFDVISSNLKREGISIYEGENRDDFSLNDELGIPFTVLLSDESLNEPNKGVIRVRDRDTQFIEPVNAKVLSKWLKLNLGIYKT